MTATPYLGRLAAPWSASSPLPRCRPWLGLEILLGLGILLAGCAPLVQSGQGVQEDQVGQVGQVAQEVQEAPVSRDARVGHLGGVAQVALFEQVDPFDPVPRWSPASPRLAGPGTGAEVIQVERGVIVSGEDCGLDYRLYWPARPLGSELVVLAHGFLGHKGHLDDLARALATAGVRAVTLDLCPSPVGPAAANSQGLAMVRLARGLGIGPNLYLGFSAGAQAALLAAHHDPRSLGVIALDPVVLPGAGWPEALRPGQTQIALVGEPGPCNLRQGRADALAGWGSGWRVQRISGAGHCDFLSPPGPLCAWVCGDPAPDSARRQAIIELAVAAVKDVLGRESSPWPPI